MPQSPSRFAERVLLPPDSSTDMEPSKAPAGAETSRASTVSHPLRAPSTPSTSRRPMASQFITEVKRTHSCGALRAADIGKEVVLFGWVQNRRDHGTLIFIDLRDRDGLTQIVFDPDLSKDSHQLAESLRSEWVLGIRGRVRSRGEQFSKKENKMVSATNPNLATGAVEVEVLEATIFNKSETPPFEISEFNKAGEELRLQYRYLDLRR